MCIIIIVYNNYTYGSESWTTRRKQIDALLVFEMKCLRAILRITRSD